MAWVTPSNKSPGELVTAGAWNQDVVSNPILLKTSITDTGDLKPITAAPATPDIDTIYKDSLVKAWVNINGAATPTIRDDVNVSSITDNGVGDYTINFATEIDTANYVPVQMVEYSGAARFHIAAVALSTGSVQIQVENVSGTGVDQDAYIAVVGS